jgi:hypothetical protein
VEQGRIEPGHAVFAEGELSWQEELWRAKEVGRNPRILEYEHSYGPSASYYAWEAAGGPVHGVRAS